MGESAGFTLRKVGGLGISRGSNLMAVLIAVCTSRAAASMSRLSANWIVMPVVPSELLEVIESIPAIVLNCRSSTVATDDAMVSGLAPGTNAVTCSVGKSTFGKSLTGSF